MIDNDNARVVGGGVYDRQRAPRGAPCLLSFCQIFILSSGLSPDYLSLLTSLHPLEDRDTVEVWTFQYYQYFIFRTHHNWRLDR